MLHYEGIHFLIECPLLVLLLRAYTYYEFISLFHIHACDNYLHSLLFRKKGQGGGFQDLHHYLVLSLFKESLWVIAISLDMRPMILSN